jgi:hypothetical protein
MGTVATITEPSGSDKPLLSDKVMTEYGPYRWADIITDTKCMYCSTVMVREKVTGGWTNCMGSRDSSIGVVSQLWFGQSGFRFFKTSRPACPPPHPKLLPPTGKTSNFMTSSLVSTVHLMLVRFTIHPMSVGLYTTPVVRRIVHCTRCL